MCGGCAFRAASVYAYFMEALVLHRQVGGTQIELDRGQKRERRFALPIPVALSDQKAAPEIGIDARQSHGNDQVAFRQAGADIADGKHAAGDRWRHAVVTAHQLKPQGAAEADVEHVLRRTRV